MWCFCSENATSVANDSVLVFVNIGLCETNNLILDDTFVWYYQRAYVSMYVICLLVVIVLYVAVFSAVLRQRSRRQQRRRNQMAAAANSAATLTTRTAGPYRTEAELVTEMATVVHEKRNDAGVVDGAEVMIVTKEDRPTSAVVQTSKSNFSCEPVHPRQKRMEIIYRTAWLILTHQYPHSEIVSCCPNVEVQYINWHRVSRSRRSRCY